MQRIILLSPDLLRTPLLVVKAFVRRKSHDFSDRKPISSQCSIGHAHSCNWISPCTMNFCNDAARRGAARRLASAIYNSRNWPPRWRESSPWSSTRWQFVDLDQTKPAMWVLSYVSVHTRAREHARACLTCLKIQTRAATKLQQRETYRKRAVRFIKRELEENCGIFATPTVILRVYTASGLHPVWLNSHTCRRNSLTSENDSYVTSYPYATRLNAIRD